MTAPTVDTDEDYFGDLAPILAGYHGRDRDNGVIDTDLAAFVHESDRERSLTVVYEAGPDDKASVGDLQGQARRVWNAMPNGAACRAVEKAIAAEVRKDGTSLGQMGQLLKLVRLAEQGHLGGREAAEEWAMQCRSKERAQHRMLSYAVGYTIRDGLTPPENRRCCDVDDTACDCDRIESWGAHHPIAWCSALGPPSSSTAATNGAQTPASPASPHLPDSFWEARPNSLGHIRQAAWAGWGPPDAVLHLVLTRLGAYADPASGVDLGRNDPSPLTIYANNVGAPETGKTTAARIAAKLCPVPEYLADTFRQLVPSTGEGLIESYFDLVEATGDDSDGGDGASSDAPKRRGGKPRLVKKQTRANILYHMDEGPALLKMIHGRDGQTLAETLRSMAMGAPVGQANASATTKRHLASGSYSIGISLGFQPDTIGPLLDDEQMAAGTPQRFLFSMATDPSTPDDPPECPGPLVAPPLVDEHGTAWRASTVAVHHLREIPEVIAEQRRRYLAIQRGQLVATNAEAHVFLMRGRVAAHLARLEGRLAVNAEDWALAGMVIDTSLAVRTWCIEHGRAAKVRDARQRNASKAETERVLISVHAEAAQQADEDKLNRAVLAVARKVIKNNEAGTLPSDARKAVRGELRKDYGEAAIDEAIERQWIREADDRYYPGGKAGEVPAP